MTYTITATAGAGGTIDPSGIVTISDSETKVFTLTPDSEHEISKVYIDGVYDSENVGAKEPITYTFSNVTSDHTIEVLFEDRKYVVSIVQLPETGGTTTPAGPWVEVTHGSSLTVNFNPTRFYTIAKYSVDGVDYPSATSVTLNDIKEIHTIVVYYDAKPKYIINASVEGDGEISPEGAVWVLPNEDQTFTITPTFGNKVSKVIIDGINHGPLTSYTFEHVLDNHVIKVIFDSIYKKLARVTGEDKILKRNDKLIRFKNKWGK